MTSTVIEVPRRFVSIEEMELLLQLADIVVRFLTQIECFKICLLPWFNTSSNKSYLIMIVQFCNFLCWFVINFMHDLVHVLMHYPLSLSILLTIGNVRKGSLYKKGMYVYLQKLYRRHQFQLT